MVDMVNEEIGLQTKNSIERLDDVEKHLHALGQKLMYFNQLESNIPSSVNPC